MLTEIVQFTLVFDEAESECGHSVRSKTRTAAT